MITPYTRQIEESMKAHYTKLNEKDKRSYAAIEAEKLWYWWKQYIIKLFKCGPNRLKRGLLELKQEKTKWIRKKWWWSKKKIEKNPQLIAAFDKVTEWYTAWSPVDEKINRTNLRPQEIVYKMKETENIETSVYIVKQIIIHKTLRKRKLHKGKTLKSVEWRNEQFENIKEIKDKAEQQWNPVISVDTKKKGADRWVH
jgi:hypothetical protein